MNAVLHTLTALFPEQPVPDPLPALSNERVLQTISDLSADEQVDLIADVLTCLDAAVVMDLVLHNDGIELLDVMQQKLIQLRRQQL